jgi:hypothetical protein
MKIFTKLLIILVVLLYSKPSNAQEYSINKSFTIDTELSIFKTDNPIGSLKLNADIKLNSKKSLIRIILVDKTYSEKLVFESYYQLAEGNSFSVINACDETELLNNLQPAYIKIQIIDAVITIKSFIAGSPISALESATFEKDQKTIKATKNKLKIDQLNKYIRKNGQIWAAGETNISNLPYEQKKQLFGKDNYNSNGLEYYIGGVFELDDGTASQNSRSSLKSASTTSSYIDHFDWRERHGANNPGSPYYDGDPDGNGWLTSVKNQNQLNDCWAFATVGEVEAVVNLYYNRHIDMDLSEYDITTCSSSGNCSVGGLTNSALNYVVNTGVVDEGSYPNPPPGTTVCSSSCGKSTNPTDLVKITAFETGSGISNEDDLKRMIIQSPLTGSLTYSLHHTMVLCGYQTIKAGDTLKYLVLGSLYNIVIQPNSMYIGKTYWIFKNSWGTSSNHGYMYLMIRNFNDFDFGDICKAVPPITSLHYTSNDIRCVDLDGDGYYNWGIGPKPAFPISPLCCPDEEDGDDSNPNLGPMDAYGNCTPISSPYTFPAHKITTTETWQNTTTECGNVIVKSTGNLTINGATINLEGNATFWVENGGTLTFNSGTIQ